MNFFMQIQRFQRYFYALAHIGFLWQYKHLDITLLPFWRPYLYFKPVEFLLIHLHWILILSVLALYEQISETLNACITNVLYHIDLCEIIFDLEDVDVLFALHYDLGD